MLARSLLALLALAPTVAAQTTLFHETFENGLGNWNVAGNPGASKWYIAASGGACGSLVAPFPSGTRAARFGIAQPNATCDYAGPYSSRMTTVAPIAIPAGAQHVRLHYSSFEETECPTLWYIAGNCNYDQRFVSVSVDGGQNWIDVAFGGEELVWRDVSVDLSAFAGQSVLLRFEFDPIDDGANQFLGWFVDEVRLEYGLDTPINYCKPSVNSLLCTPSIGHTGSPSLTGPDDFTLHASRLFNQRSALFLWSHTPASTPFISGMTICLAPPTARLPLATTSGSPPTQLDCTGQLSSPLTHAYLASRSLTAGDTLYFQCVARDPQLPGPSGRMLTAGLEVTILP
ncbi:MAG: hypothetical protein NTV21_14660 [Planctomycetota bacterium]|nr:hypothetical protein [Planctomycetota bacterium]